MAPETKYLAQDIFSDIMVLCINYSSFSLFDSIEFLIWVDNLFYKKVNDKMSLIKILEKIFCRIDLKFENQNREFGNLISTVMKYFDQMDQDLKNPDKLGDYIYSHYLPSDLHTHKKDVNRHKKEECISEPCSNASLTHFSTKNQLEQNNQGFFKKNKKIATRSLTVEQILLLSRDNEERPIINFQRSKIAEFAGFASKIKFTIINEVGFIDSIYNFHFNKQYEDSITLGFLSLLTMPKINVIFVNWYCYPLLEIMLKDLEFIEKFKELNLKKNNVLNIFSLIFKAPNISSELFERFYELIMNHYNFKTFRDSDFIKSLKESNFHVLRYIYKKITDAVNAKIIELDPLLENSIKLFIIEYSANKQDKDKFWIFLSKGFKFNADLIEKICELFGPEEYSLIKQLIMSTNN